MALRRARRALGRLVPSALTDADRRSAERDERERFFRGAGRHTPLLGAAADEGVLLVATADDHIGRDLFKKRTYGSKQLDAAAGILRSLGRPPAGTFVDVGAHIGATVLHALAELRFDRAVALEPDPGNLALLRANVVLNDLAERVRVLGVAASDHAGTAHLAVSAERSGEHHLLPGSGAKRHAGAGLVEVAVAPLDDLVTPEEAHGGLLKIDVEGHEAQVLRGAGRLLESGIPALIEYAPQLLRAADGLDDLHELVARRFQSVYDVRRGLKRMDVERAADAVEPLPAARVAELADRYSDGFTDLLLIPA